MAKSELIVCSGILLFIGSLCLISSLKDTFILGGFLFTFIFSIVLIFLGLLISFFGESLLTLLD